MLSSYDSRRYLIPFRSQLLPHIFTDTLVIGGGVAGMQAALESANHGDVIVLQKRDHGQSNTAYAQGGIAAAHHESDSAAAHAEDTLGAGADLCDPEAVRLLADGGHAAIEALLARGMQFDRHADGRLSYGSEAAHGQPRVLHAGGAATGRELVRCLHHHLLDHESIRVFSDCFALDILTSDTVEHRALGAITHHPRYGLQIIWARATILATGGSGMVYRETTNPRVATGDGVAMAYRAGAAVTDLEFMQFHPTTLYVAGASRVLISEAVRGDGAYLVDRDGRRFMQDVDERAELAPRDVVSRAIVDHLSRNQDEAVYLDVRHLPTGRFAERFPNLVRELEAFELDPERDLIPVHPSAHYTIGGVACDHDGRTSLAGLYACGEVAAHGLHGANRLASNSLLEGLVFGRRAARAAGSEPENPGPRKIISEIPTADHAELDLVDVRSSLRSTMWRNVGIERSGRRLDDVRDMFDFWARYTMDIVFDEPDGWEVQNLLLVGALMVQAARWRCESRGAHRRIDHPATEAEFHCRARWTRGVEAPEIVAVESARAGAS